MKKHPEQYHNEDIKIKIIVPINSSAYNNSVLNAAISVAQPNTIINIENLTKGHDCIESYQHSRVNAPYTADLIKKAETDGYHGVFVCDMDMCGIDLAKKVHGVKIPVHGGFSSNMPVAAARGNFIVMTILDTVIDMQKQYANLYGNNCCVDIIAIGLGVHQLHNIEENFDSLLNKTCHALARHQTSHIQSVIFGCSGFVNIAEPLGIALIKKGYHNITVIDPNRTAISVIEKEVLQIDTPLLSAHAQPAKHNIPIMK